MQTRRQFMKLAATAGAALCRALRPRRGWAFAQSPTKIRKFVTALPGLGPSGAKKIGQYIPLATKNTTTFAGLSTDVYRLGVKQFGEKMHPDLSEATHFWGYYDLATGDQKILGWDRRCQEGQAGFVQHNESTSEQTAYSHRSDNQCRTEYDRGRLAAEPHRNSPSRWLHAMV
jgi:hypothetical protein